ncbi:hypothetical protein ASE01_06975 [Nocardioides sp. Root190]|uniref:serine/threonine-protein kinase n=1 Tax=Nocardioides sp. Root190 TaxID=1736488 RepID=UPI000701AE49|nr:serine/threonine-protein kinase [Nocardioides sp. Root190]KRB77917.1 hypothetical protein ASE01_06975 [Nocardioides sp. Root190]
MTGPGAGEPLRVVAGRYELLQVVGSGGMGVVYRGRDRVLDRTVAVKMIRAELADEDFVRRFEREAAILARLRSPHIVVVYDYGDEDGTFYLVTDFLGDGDLAEWLVSHSTMSPLQAAGLMAQLAEGLADAHAAGVIHRDIKPGNVLLWRRAGVLQPVLGDFGIAVTEDLSLTATGGVIGSPHFMAPERHLGQPATVASDIYAMGCLLYNVLVGRAPFEGTVFQTANAHLNAPVPSLPRGLPAAPELDAIITECMAKEPGDRVATAAALAERLRAVVTKYATPAIDPSLPPPPPPPSPGVPASSTAPTTAARPVAATGPRRTGRVAASLAAVVAVVAAIAGAAWWISRDEDTPTGPSADDSSSTTEPTAPAAPSAVDAEVTRGERTVTIDVDLPASDPGVQVVVEQQVDAQWVPAESVIELPTAVGRGRACATLRLVAVADGLRTPGQEDEVCGRAAAPAISLQRGEPDCENPSKEFAGRPCVWINVSVTGLRANQDYRITLKEDDLAPKPELFTSDADGRFSLTAGLRDGTRYGGGIYIGASTEVLTMSVIGSPSLERRFVVADLR